MIRQKQANRTPIIDLTGPQGNVFFLIASAKKYAKQLGIDAGNIVKDMMSSDYDNAIEVFDNHFGAFVILER